VTAPGGRLGWHRQGLQTASAGHPDPPRYDVRNFRLLTLLFVLVTLPGYGLAGLAQRSCQEQMRVPNDVSLAGDCCPGKADQGTPCKQLGDGPLNKNGPCSACKAGYTCKSPQPLEPVNSLVLLIPITVLSLSTSPAPLLSSHSPDGLWRPPRFV
jgi:hypothetical protein